jgi:hypothetical protein
LHSEILEQPERLAQLVKSERKAAAEIARAIRSHDISYVFLAARGTSDNAGRYANYLLGAANRLPLALAAPSLFTYYGQPPDLKGAFVIAGKFNLQVRGTRGEHTEAEGGIYDISNKRRMGLTEYQAVKEMYDGLQELIRLEKAA